MFARIQPCRRGMWLLAVVLAASGLRPVSVIPSEPPASVLLFDSGHEGYPRYRIPAVLAAPNGDLLAFCEGRRDGGGFKGNIDLVMKRSTDSGRTWQPLVTIADDGPHTLGYPVPVVDAETKTIWLACTRSRGDDTEDQITAGTSREQTRVWMMSSRDNGRSWSSPVDISSTTKRPAWTWYGLGSGIGIQMPNGRLVIPAYHAVAETKVYRSHAIFSDDHGQTWQAGEPVADHCGECQIAVRRNGVLYLNARNQGGVNLRVTALSADGGATWNNAAADAGLFDPICQGVVYALPSGDAGKPVWLFANPAGPNRRNLSIRVSRDEGRTWSAGRRLHEGSGEYSCLVELPEGNVGCLFERWETGNYRIRWAIAARNWLLAESED